MKDFIENIDEIEAYLRGEMNTESLASFESKMRSDELLREQVAEVRDLISGIKLASESRLKKKLDSTESKLDKDSFFQTNTKTIKMSQTRKINWVPMVAGLAMLIAAGVFMMKPDAGTATDPTKLFAEYYKPDTEVIKDVLDRMDAKGLAKETTEDDEKLKSALMAYSKYDYTSARTKLSGYLEEFPEDQTARFYMGLTQLHMANYATATEYLQPLCTEEGFPYKDQAKWYLAMGCTQISGPDGMVLAKKYLGQLANDNTSEYQGNAKSYLMALED